MIKSILLLTILIASLTASAQSKISTVCYDKTRPLSFIKGQATLQGTILADNVRIYIVRDGQENGSDHLFNNGLLRWGLRGGGASWAFEIPFEFDLTKPMPWLLLTVNGTTVDRKQLSSVGCN